MLSGNSVVVIVSNEPWGDMWFSKHYFAKALSNNYPTYFLNPAMAWNAANALGKAKFKSAAPNLTVVDYSNRFPSRIKRKGEQTIWAELAKEIGPNRPIILWQFDPFRFGHEVPHCHRIYHVVDPYHEVDTDREIAKQSDLIVCVNDLLAKEYDYYGEKTITIPHAFNSLSLTETPGNYALLAGTINHSTDLQLIHALLDKLTDQKLVFVGQVERTPGQELQATLNHPNFEQHAARSPKELAEFITNAAVCIVPYLNEGIHKYRSPLKIVTYAQYGKPVVTTNPNFHLDMEGTMVFPVNTTDLFIDLTLKGLNHELEVNTEVLERLASEHSYSAVIEKIIFELKSRIEP